METVNEPYINITLQNDVINSLIYKLNNKDIINFIILSENPLEQFKTILHNGFILSKCKTPENMLCEYPEFKELKDSILPITELFNTGGNSSKNGTLCEILMGESFRKTFPGFQYTETASTDRTGDAIVIIDNLEIMVEYKNYDKVIPSSEVDKLLRDLKIQNIPMGILYSTKSKITKRDMIDYDVIDGKLIVFLSGEGISSNSLLLGIKFLIHLHKANIVSLEDKVCSLVNKTMAHKLQSMFTKLIELRESLQRHNEKMDDTSEKMIRLMCSLKEDSVHMLSSVVSIVDEISEVIVDNHRETDVIVTPHVELVDFVNRSTDKKKDITQCLQLLNVAEELSIVCGISELNHIYLFKNLKEIGRLKITKSNATLIMYNLVKGPTMFDSEYEQIKNGHFHINLIDSQNVWNIIKKRFI
jgi:hypothetical protein